MNERKINDLELAVRTIDDMLPDIPTAGLQRWQGILSGTLAKIEKELTATMLHTCRICFFQEYGYRDELPSAWYKKGDAHICFQHEYAESEKLLKDAGHDVDAFFPVEVPDISVGALQVTSNSLPPPKKEYDHTLEELMDLI
jgi:hypothetical protein